MSTTLTGEPQPKANGKGTHSERRRVGDTVAPPILDWRDPQAVFDYKDACGNLLYQNVRLPLVKDGSPILSSKGSPTRHSACVVPMEKADGLKIPMMLLRCLIACRTWSSRSWTVRPYSSQRVKPQHPRAGTRTHDLVRNPHQRDLGGASG